MTLCPPSPGPVLLYVVTEDHYFLSHRLSLAQAAQAQGYRVCVAANPTGREGEIIAAGLEFYPLPFHRGGMNPFYELKIIWALFRLYKTLRPHIVHLIALKPVLYGGWAARLCSFKPQVVGLLGGLGYLFTENTFLTHLLRPFIRTGLKIALSSPSTVLIVQNSQDEATLKQSLPGVAIRLIEGSGVNTQIFTPPVGQRTHTPPRVVLISRLLWTKGVGELVEAAALLKSEGLEFTLDLVGDTDPENPAAIPLSTLQEWEEKGILRWLGQRSEVAPLYQSATIAVLPSYREGLPKTLLEAAACGCAVITTDVPGCKAVVVHQVTGLLVPPREAAPLAQALRQLIQDPERCSQLGQEGRRRVLALFDEKIIHQQTIELYKLSEKDNLG